MSHTSRQKYKYAVDNKLGSFGETDLEKGTVKINKKLHAKAKKNPARYGLSKEDTSLLNTIAHEKMHTEHPKMHERTVRKNTRVALRKMAPKQKKKLYTLVK